MPDMRSRADLRPIKSLGPAMPWIRRLVSRSRSPKPRRNARSPARCDVSRRQASTAVSLDSRASMSSKGWVSQRRKRRPPMGVRVSSSTPSREPLLIRSRIVSVNSRFRRVTVSKVMNASTE
ncbi:hypothetical protein ES703_125515 [subsurface metagenome]